MPARGYHVDGGHRARLGIAFAMGAGLEIIAEPPEAFAALIRRELDKYAKLTKAIGFKPM